MKLPSMRESLQVNHSQSFGICQEQHTKFLKWNVICEVLIQDYFYESIHYYLILHKHPQDLLSPCCPILFPLSPKIKAERNEIILQNQLWAIFYNSLGLKFLFMNKKMHVPCCGVTLLPVHKQHCLFCVRVPQRWHSDTESQSILRFGVGRDSQGSSSPSLKWTAHMANSWPRHCWADCQVSTNHGFQGPHINSHFSFLHIKTVPVDSRGGICCSCNAAHREPLCRLTFDAVVQVHTEETKQKENSVFSFWIILLLFSAGEDYCTIFHWGMIFFHRWAGSIFYFLYLLCEKSTSP